MSTIKWCRLSISILLAMLYQAQGKDEQAEPLLQRALAICEKQLGPEHPSTAQSLNNLAGFYDEQGKYEQAEPLYKHALQIREQSLGLQHPRAQQTRQNYATFLLTMGHYEEAKQLEEGSDI
jgi:tetratricopeptide (TPR) repeat protein